MFDSFARAWAKSGSGPGQSTNDSRNDSTSGAQSKKGKGSGTTSSPTILREDLYKAIQAAERWLNTSTPGDSFSYRPVLTIVKPHYPDLEVPFGCGPEEVSILVGAITNMALEVGTLDGLGGVVVMRSWVDTLEKIIKGWKTKSDAAAGARICEGIVQGVNHRAEPAFLSPELAARVQIVNLLKKVGALVYEGKDAEKRQSDALWGSRLISS